MKRRKAVGRSRNTDSSLDFVPSPPWLVVKFPHKTPLSNSARAGADALIQRSKLDRSALVEVCSLGYDDSLPEPLLGKREPGASCSRCSEKTKYFTEFPAAAKHSAGH